MSDDQKSSLRRRQRYFKKIFSFLSTLFLLSICLSSYGAASRKTPPQSSIEPAAAAVKKKYIQQIGPTSESEPSEILNVYRSVVPNKSLSTSTRFQVIDDFNSGELRNKFGDLWKINKEKAQEVDLKTIKEDARGIRGHSLEMRFHLQKQENIELLSSLAKLNMTKADFLVLKCRLKNQEPGRFEGRVRVSLSDWTGKTVVRDITDACQAADGWNDVTLPMSSFRGIDLRKLDHIAFYALTRTKPASGNLGIDEIAFFGPEEVGFESVLASLKGFPKTVLDSKRREELLKTGDDKQLLLKIARDTWKYFENGIDKEHHLVVDHLKIGDFPLAATYTSPTNIALDLMATAAARELGFISQGQAAERVEMVLKALQAMKRWKGFFYNYYEVIQLEVTRKFISSVDNGWLAISLVVVRQAFPGKIAETATALLNNMNFQEFLDPDNNHLFIGYDAERDALTPYHYGLLATEARAMSLYAIGKGDVPEEHWWFLYRTAPQAWTWQNQAPQGKMVTQDGINYFQGYYTDGQKKFIPSWGGSLFEFLMPTIVINEKKFAPQGLGLNNRIVTEIQIDYALKEKKYPVWGISPAAVSSGRHWQYGEYGIKKLGVKGYPDRGVITPHVSFLALETLPKDAIKNIRQLLQFDIYGEYGFYDSITFPEKKVNHQYLGLDQGMVLIPIANHLKNGVIQEYFHKDEIGENIKKLLKEENFF